METVPISPAFQARGILSAFNSDLHPMAGVGICPPSVRPPSARPRSGPPLTSRPPQADEVPSDPPGLLHLGHLLRAAPDATSRKRLMLAEACRLVGAARGACVVVHMDPSTGRRTVLSAIRFSAAEGSAGACAGGSAGATAMSLLPADASAEALRRAAGLGHCIDSFLSLRRLDAVAWLAVGHTRGRSRGSPAGKSGKLGRRAFSPEDHARLDALHARCGWVYEPDLLLAAPDVLALTPRRRQVLQALLGGDGERRTAERLRLSPNTVHHHVKALYRHFDVSSRGELLSRWIGGRAAEPLAETLAPTGTCG